MTEFEIYTTAICPYCVAAKNFLKHRGCGYREIRSLRPMDAVETQHLTRRYGDKLAVDDLTVTVEPGRFGVLRLYTAAAMAVGTLTFKRRDV